MEDKTREELLALLDIFEEGLEDDFEDMKARFDTNKNLSVPSLSFFSQSHLC